ncbi:transcriptional regulator [Thermanaeromonas toyohensis]|nr:transcriptional regulator [Thermanaeromonas toyohensis]
MEMVGGPFSLPHLDENIHPPARLQIMTVLCGLPERDRIAFTKLQELLGFSAGNLSTCLARLEQVGYVRMEKAFRGKRPVTWIAATRRGRQAFEEYIQALRRYLNEVDAIRLQGGGSG